MARKNAQRILNCLPSHGQERDWLLEDARAAGALAAARIPVRKDLRQTWWAIGDQGETGSCVGWAAADSVLRWHFVQAGTLGKAEPLSVRFVWMAAKETDEFVGRPTTFIESDGTSLKAALDIARKYGAVADELLPFGKGALFPGRAETFYATASRLRIASYFNLGTDPAAWREWLAGNGPVLTRLDVDRIDEPLGNCGRETAGEVAGPTTHVGHHSIGRQAERAYHVIWFLPAVARRRLE